MASESEQTLQSKMTYRVEGFTCANCAGKFEQNVKGLPGVTDAKVNFGASKITVYGRATIEELEQAGRFEQLKVRPEKDERKSIKPGDHANTGEREEAEPVRKMERIISFLKKHARSGYALLLATFGYVSLFVNGETNILTPLLFGTSMLIGGFSLFKTGLLNLLKLDFDMKTLMTVAIIGAVIIGEWAEGAVVVVLFAISEALERFSMDRARQSIRSLMNIAPREATVRRGTEEIRIPADQIAIGDIVLVKPGQSIAVDGIVVRGTSAVNQAPITGESVPVAKGEGDEVFAGTLNGDGFLEVRATRLTGDSAIARIIHLVEEAQAERAPAQTFVDAFAKYYTPAIMAFAALVAVIPPLFLKGEWATWIYEGLSVLVVGCPCALVISTPVAIVTAIGHAAKNGVLIKGGIHLETLGSAEAFAFDKTGTLTNGTPIVTDYIVFHEETDKANLLAAIAALEKRANHPLADAILRKAKQEGADDIGMAVEHFESVTGKGVRGSIHGTLFTVGSVSLFREPPFTGLSDEHQFLAQSLQQQGKTVILAGAGHTILALLALKDTVRDTAKPAIDALHRLGIRRTVLLTGDNRIAAEAIRHETGITEARAELLPEEKRQAVQSLETEFGKTVMVGDGINDAPALAAASVGIAMGGAGTDIALETADVALMGDDLGKLPYAIRLSRKSLAVIKQNITFSLAIKLLALLLVIPGWLTLWIAILSDMGATLLVTLNALRLMKAKVHSDS